MDDVLYGAVCNNVVKLKYFSEGGFITRGLFCNHGRFIGDHNIIYKPAFHFECFEIYRNKKIIIKDETRILEASFDSPDGVKSGQIVYGEAQPTPEFVQEIKNSFPEDKNPLSRGSAKKISFESKKNLIEFFTGIEYACAKNKINQIIDDLLCSEIFYKVPIEEMFLDYIGKGESPQEQWRKIIEVYIELSVQEIKSDKSMSINDKKKLVDSIKRCSGTKIENLSSLASVTWPRELMPKPSWFSS